MKVEDLIQHCQSDWQAYTQHPFVEQLAAGTLPQAMYQHYLQQDFLFLKQYARAYALAIYKARTLAEMRHGLPSLQALLDSEIAHHVSYCEQWGLSEAAMEQTPEAPGTVAYTRYVLDSGCQGDATDLYVALAPCALGYAQIGRERFHSEIDLDSNPYGSWLALYGGDEFQTGVTVSRDHLEALLAEIDADSVRGNQLKTIFATATRMEVAFWQQSIDACL